MSFQVQLNAEVGAGRSCFPFLFGCRAKFRLPSEAGKECPDCENPTYKRYTFERDDAMQTVIGFYQGGPWGQGLSIEGGVVLVFKIRASMEQLSRLTKQHQEGYT